MRSPVTIAKEARKLTKPKSQMNHKDSATIPHLFIVIVFPVML